MRRRRNSAHCPVFGARVDSTCAPHHLRTFDDCSCVASTQKISRSFSLAVLTALSNNSQAQSGAAAAAFPTKPVTLVVGFAPSGSADILACLLAQKLSTSLRQPVVVENKPDAGATIAAALVAGAPSDGHTLLLATSGHAGSGALYPSLSYDPIRSFTPTIKLGATPVVIVVPAAARL